MVSQLKAKWFLLFRRGLGGHGWEVNSRRGEWQGGRRDATSSMDAASAPFNVLLHSCNGPRERCSGLREPCNGLRERCSLPRERCSGYAGLRMWAPDHEYATPDYDIGIMMPERLTKYFGDLRAVFGSSSVRILPVVEAMAARRHRMPFCQYVTRGGEDGRAAILFVGVGCAWQGAGVVLNSRPAFLALCLFAKLYWFFSPGGLSPSRCCMLG